MTELWALLYLHDWDPDGEVYPEIHAVYETEKDAIDAQRKLGFKYHVRRVWLSSPPQEL
jgi:hypothetical protein